MKVYIPEFNQYEEVVRTDKENNKVITLFRGHLENEYDLEDVEIHCERCTKKHKALHEFCDNCRNELEQEMQESMNLIFDSEGNNL